MTNKQHLEQRIAEHKAALELAINAADAQEEAFQRGEIESLNQMLVVNGGDV